MDNKATDFLIECGNPEAFDRTIQTFGAALIQNGPNYIQKDGYYVMRAFGNTGFIEFAIANQGYGKVIKQLDHLL